MEKIQAIVEEIIFRNEENGYSVVQVRAGKQSTSAVGVFPMLGPGEHLMLTGEWVEHPQYGKQIKVEQVEMTRPSTLTGIERYLGSGLIRGIGPATAKRLVERFGKDTLDILQYAPERICELPGMGPKKARQISESYQEQTQMREAMIFLQTYGISPALAVKIFKAYGDQVRHILQTNPYAMVEDIQGIGFRTADSIAASLGIAPESPQRLSAGIKHTLSEAGVSAGHTFLYREMLVEYAASLLNVSPELLEHTLDELILGHDLVAQMVQERVAVYLPLYYAAEGEVATRLMELKEASPRGEPAELAAALEQMEKMGGLAFHAQQRQAILTAVSSGMTVITGGPGTGKTTIITTILHLIAGEGEVALAAPTGRAAKRMTEATGVEAKTLHRLLEYGGDEGRFSRGDSNPLEYDTVIVDEMSMVDIFLMRGLLRALLPGTRLIMVGDADQLPSVGAGNVLGDILASEVIPSVRLTEVFRQDEHSIIALNAHRINRGEMPVMNQKDSDFFFEAREMPGDAAGTIVALCEKRLPGFLGVDSLRDIQVLSPTKKGECGVWALNALLQARLNPPERRKGEFKRGETLFRQGDKVMQTKNNYQTVWTRDSSGGLEQGEGIFNGDMGFIQSVDEDARLLRVVFDDDRLVTYEGNQIEELELAYCISVHKSQGSEFPVVVMPVVGGPPMLLTRNLFYTAVTRARRLVMLVGRESAIRTMIENAHIRERYSALKDRLLTLAQVRAL